MKIAVTYENGQVFQHFGHCEQFKLYDAAGEPEDIWTYKQRQYDKLAAALRESLDLPAIYRILDRGLEKGGAAR